MIVGYKGPLGSGKTLKAVMDAYRWSLAAGGAPIWANITIRPGPFEAHRQKNPTGFKIGFLRSTWDILRMAVEGGGIALFDEFHQCLDARLSMNEQNILLTQLLVFLRKCQITPEYTTQHESQVDRRLRGVTDILTVCASYGPREARNYNYTLWNYQGRYPLLEQRVASDEAQLYYAMYDTNQFTHPLRLPHKASEWATFMEQLEEGKDFALRYRGAPDKAWPTFLQETGYSPEGAAKGGRGVSAGKRTPKAPHRSRKPGVQPGAGGGAELEAEA